MRMRKRNDETGEFEHTEVSWQDVVTLGLTRSQIQGGVIMLWRMAIMFHVAWVCNFLAPIGLEQPFARIGTLAETKSEVKMIIAELQQDRVDRLEAEIFSTRRLQCTALKTGTPDQQRQYGDRLNELIGKYRKITQGYPRVPTCDEV